MSEPETGFFRGAGGAIVELRLPLTENLENQCTRGQLVRVNADGSPFEEPKADDLKQPAKSASKDEWVGYALKADPALTVDDADAMTKNDLVEKYGK